MASKKDKKWDQEQEVFRRVVQSEPLLLFVAVIRNAFNEEAKALEAQLSDAGLTTYERENIYKQLNQRRLQLEAELDQPGAYGRVKAQAYLFGLLTPPEVSLETSGKEANP
jgi:hypothetical protein